jgi:hypothetical protein
MIVAETALTARAKTTGNKMVKSFACALAACIAVASPALADRPKAVTVFGGNLLDNVWEDVFLAPQDLTFEKSYIVGGAGSVVIAEPVEGLRLELEAQLVRHFGDQDHWEANLPILTARWSRFPWSDAFDMSAAYGLGLSWTSEKPVLEVQSEGDSEQLMAYWMIELDAALPVPDWRVVARLHHRSTAYGLFGDDGGSNALVLGMRRAF